MALAALCGDDEERVMDDLSVVSFTQAGLFPGT
jgi:hypothetical protein